MLLRLLLGAVCVASAQCLLTVNDTYFCDDDTVLRLNEGDTGIISGSTSGTFTGNLTSQTRRTRACTVQLLGCDSCRFVITISNTSPWQPCRSNISGHYESTRCQQQCSYLVLYEPAYTSATLHMYHLSTVNLHRVYTTWSSKLNITFCAAMGDRGLPTNRSFVMHYKVQEKKQIYLGSSLSDNADEQVVTSPNFPGGYALRGERYKYIFHNTHPNGTLLIKFDDWDLTPYSRVMFYHDEDTLLLISVHYGNYFRPIIRSVGPLLVMVFETDVQMRATSQHIGFSATYRFMPGHTEVAIPSTDCGGNIRKSHGRPMVLNQSHSVHCVLYDCIWTLNNTDNFHKVRLKAQWRISTGSKWNLLIKSGITSRGTMLTNTSVSPFTDMRNITWFGHDGFYIRFRGVLKETDYVVFPFLFYDVAHNGSCGRQGRFLCDGDICIDGFLVCDGISNCDDGTDESTCNYSSPRAAPSVRNSFACGLQEYRCQNGARCIPLRMLCDQWMDCPDGSDEYLCTSSIAPQVRKAPIKCPRKLVPCRSGDQCILKWQVCDHYINCWDKSDEYNCDLETVTSEVGSHIWRILIPVSLSVSVVLLCCLVALRYKWMCKDRHHHSPIAATRPSFLPLFGADLSASTTTETLMRMSRSISGSTPVCPLSPPSYDDVVEPSSRERDIFAPEVEVTSSLCLDAPPPYNDSRDTTNYNTPDDDPIS